MVDRKSAISVLVLLALFLFSCTSSAQYPTIVAVGEDSCPTPDPQLSISELIQDLEGKDGCARMSAAWALSEIGEEAAPAVPALMANLYYVGHSDIRRWSAEALGSIGTKSRPAVPILIGVLLGDSIKVRVAAAEALAGIGDKSAVPALSLALQDDPYIDVQFTEVQIAAAEALRALSGQEFPDSGGSVYTLDEEGTPIIVLAARDWWFQEGQHQTWVNP